MRFFLTTILSKLLKKIIEILNLGAGYTWPGHFALRIYPNILNDDKIKFNKGLVVVTGTNGKTTTSKLISHILESKGFSVLNNKTGANLINGIVSSIVLSTNLSGNLDYDYGVLEIDEFALPSLLNFFEPDALVLLNLSRDQLDRYGETDIIIERWLESFANKSLPNIVVDSETSQFEALTFNDSITKVHTFNSNDEYSKQTKLKGKFNTKNLNAALTVLNLLGFEKKDLLHYVSSFDFAYGRGENISNFYLYLAKNPASFNNNLSILDEFDASNTCLLIVLNDNIPDGRDVSWIFDISTDLLHQTVSNYSHIYISGSRCYDMAVRLHYAGVNVVQENISLNLELVVSKIKKDFPAHKVIAFPNYSAMLELRKLLTGKAIL